jgi:hypothetical protein
MRRVRWIVSLLVIVGIGALLARPRGVKTLVRNRGTKTMRDVQVIVTGRSYSIGDIPRREEREVRVNPKGESALALRYLDAGRVERRLTVDCYFESGYSGSITVDVVDGAVGRVDNRVGLPPLL